MRACTRLQHPQPNLPVSGSERSWCLLLKHSVHTSIGWCLQLLLKESEAVHARIADVLFSLLPHLLLLMSASTSVFVFDYRWEGVLRQKEEKKRALYKDRAIDFTPKEHASNFGEYKAVCPAGTHTLFLLMWILQLSLTFSLSLSLSHKKHIG
jgi:hypothetical protein